MKQFVGICIFIVIVLLLGTSQVSAAPIVTELHPAPASGQPEWVELHNPDSVAIDLTGWQLWDELSTPSLLLTLNTTLAPQDTQVFELPSAKLNNAADGFSLRLPDGTVQDSFSYTNSEPTLSWLRIAQHWQLGTATPGSYQATSPSSTPTPSPTPPASNEPTPTPSPHPALVPTPQPSTPPTTHINLKLTELYPCPPTGEQEYITITNTGSSAIDLGQLLIRDEQHNTRTTSGTLTPESITTISWSTAMLNNAGDTVSVVTISGQVLDSAQYTNCETGLPLVLRSGSWFAELEMPIMSISAQEALSTPKLDSIATASQSAAISATATYTATTRSPVPPPIPRLLQSDTADILALSSNQTANTIQYIIKKIPLLAIMSVILGGALLTCGGYIVLAASTHHTHTTS